MRYATRINSFLRDGQSLKAALNEIGSVTGLNFVDLNYPEHMRGITAREMKEMLDASRLKLNAVNLRFRDEYLHGIFSNSSADVRKRAIKLCQEAAEWCALLGGTQIIVWLGFDGYDYSFQCNYEAAWERLADCFARVCQRVDCRVSIEYKPYEERAFALLESWGSAWQMVQAAGCSNLGITLDFCHMLMKKENPAFAAALLLEKGKLYGIHLNDGEGSCDDGLMVGSVNFWKLLELYYYLMKYRYEGVIYFDTFPKRESAVRECRMNIQICAKIETLIGTIGLSNIQDTIERNDGIAVMEMLYGLV